MSDYQTAFIQYLGERIRALRVDSALTRRELSLRSGVSERYLASLEGGRANPSIAILCRLAMALGHTVHGLLGDVDQQLRALRAGGVASAGGSAPAPRQRVGRGSEVA